MYKRKIINTLIEALSDTPVILVNGARQTGKSTLCKEILECKDFQGQLLTMDDPVVLLAARKDPMGFLNDLSKHLIIDEVQRAPELFLPIKKLVDDDRKDRRIILTGSSDVMMLPKVGDSLAGRISTYNLWPLAQDEIQDVKSNFLNMLIDKKAKKNPRSSSISWKAIAKKIRIGGYPEALARISSTRRNKWFSDYLISILQKDIRDLANIEGLTEIPNVLKLIATRIGSTINMSDIGRLSGITNTTLKRYIALLEHIFLIIKIPAWTKNTEGQLVKSPKIYLNDSGLLNHLIGLEDNSFLEQRHNAGAYLENFVIMEIIKQLSWSDFYLKPYHFSLHKGSEVDLVLEDRTGALYGIEIKSTATLRNGDFNGLRRLSEIAKGKFKKGILLYTGEQYLSGFGSNLYAVPVSSVWET